MPSSRILAVNSIEMFLLEQGTGPLVVLCHGWPELSYSWRHQIPVIAEEEVAAGRIPAHGDTYFLVDPLDGTKEFVRGGDDYTVNIGLIENGQPRLGVVYQPATGKLWGGLVGGCTGGDTAVTFAGRQSVSPVHSRHLAGRPVQHSART